jgi:hypothetical protein
MSGTYSMMSIKELRNEIKQCNNLKKKKLLKKLIKLKEDEKPIQNNQNNQMIENDPLDDLLQLQKEDNINLIENNEIVEEQYDKPRTQQLKSLVSKDLANNKMMERMNGELNFRISGYDKKYIDKPYIDDIRHDNRGIQYFNSSEKVSYINKSKNHDIPIMDFSSKKLVEMRF